MVPILSVVPSLIGGSPRLQQPAKNRAGLFIRGLFGGNTDRSNLPGSVPTSTSVPAAPIQQRSLASGTVTFGQDQKKTYLGFGLLIVALVFVYRFFSPKRRKRR